MVTFWKWLRKGSGGAPAGFRNIVNFYLIVHVTVGVLASSLIKSDPFSFASKALFPAASILIGMSLAWTTRASAILQTKELRDALFTQERPAEDYVFGFQLSILIVIIMVAYVATMAGGGLDVDLFGQGLDANISGFWLYFLLSLSIRECWGVINFTNMLSMLEYRRSQGK